MTVHAYLFEAKSIQSYILDSGRVRDLVGASELVDSLTGSLLDQALEGLGAGDGEVQFSRRAGGAFYAFSKESGILAQLARLWSLLVQQYAPGLAYDVGQGCGATEIEAFDEAHKVLRADNSRVRPQLPVGAPVVERSRRTGGLAVKREKDGSLDAATARKRYFSQRDEASLTQRFSPCELDQKSHDWPRDLTPGAKNAFPFQGEEHTLAVIHADGNGLGQLLKNARVATAGRPGSFIDNFRRLSEGIGEATRNAAQAATREVLMPEREARGGGPLAARPIILGGDDMTILVRADLAIPFVLAFLTAFEIESAKILQEQTSRGISGLGKCLTAGAGIVYMRAYQPFYLAMHLAESLMDEAKQRAKACDRDHPASTLVFHRVTTSMIEEYDTIVAREMTTREGENDYVQTLGAYAVRQHDELPNIQALLELQALFQEPKMSRGPIRQLLTLMGLSPIQARKHYDRWRQQMLERDKQRPNQSKSKNESQLDRFDRLVSSLAPGFDGARPQLPFGERGKQNVSPIGDVLTLMSVKNALAENKLAEKEGAK